MLKVIAESNAKVLCCPPFTLYLQEGWHLELDDPSDPLTYKGVVFNEMKGVYSSPDSMFYRTVQQVGTAGAAATNAATAFSAPSC